MRRVLTVALGGLLQGSVLVVAGTAQAVAADGTGADPGFGDPGGSGGSGGFGVVVVLAVLLGIGITIYKVAMARDLAEKSGMDPDQATAMTLLTDDGLEATYLASNLRPPAGPAADPPAAGTALPARTTAERLQELDALREQGLVTQAEYDERRAAILGSI